MLEFPPTMFKLQCPTAELPALIKAYDAAQDAPALAAGRLIRAGDTNRDHVETIFEWKTRGRGGIRFLHNTDAEITDVLTLAMQAKTERAAIAVLTGLNGVLIPIASAILTAIFPERYTVIDFRSLEALGISRAVYSLNFYLGYLAKCRELAAASQVTLLNLDRALWQWSINQG